MNAYIIEASQVHGDLFTDLIDLCDSRLALARLDRLRKSYMDKGYIVSEAAESSEPYELYTFTFTDTFKRGVVSAHTFVAK